MTNEAERAVHRSFDVFVSYASEDRHQVQHLVRGLRHRNVKVWWDHGEITLGDTLSKRIDEGLKHSRYGVVIISKSSIGKGWPESELQSLLNRSIGSGEKVILPIRLALSHEEFSTAYPLLRDVVTAEFGDDIDALVNEILRAIKWTEVPRPRVEIETPQSDRHEQSVRPRRHVVFIIHGIRTQAEWATRLVDPLEADPAIAVIPLRYQFFDSIRFLVPGLRRGPVNRILRYMRDELSRKDEFGRSPLISVISHSFGTYIIGTILANHPDIKIKRLVLCGCILPDKFDWARISEQQLEKATERNKLKEWHGVNDCGMRDPWPVAAKFLTFGYGSTGRFGFGGNRIKDRYFDSDHGGFFRDDHVETYWKPYILNGEIVDGVRDREITPWLTSVLTLTKLPYIALVVGLLLLSLTEPRFPTCGSGDNWFQCVARYFTAPAELNEDTGRESDRVEATPVAEVTPVADNVAATGSLLWRYRTGGLVRSSPAMADGVVYIGSDDGHVYALSSSTGELLWRFPTNGYVWSTPNVVDRVVYVGSHDNYLYALNASTGEVFWEFQTSDELATSAEVADGIVYVASGTHLYALDASTGSVTWQHDVGRGGVTSPVFVADAIVDEASCVVRGQVTECQLRDGVLVGSRNQLLALDASNGNPLWRYRTGNTVHSTPTVAAGYVYFGSTDGYLYALGADRGELQWRHETEDAVYSSPAVADGLVYIGSYDHHLYALDAFTGERVWRYQTGRAVYSSPTVADGVVYIASFDSYLYAVDASSGGLLWRYLAGRTDPGSHAPWSSPKVANGVVYVGADDNHVYALAVAASP